MKKLFTVVLFVLMAAGFCKGQWVTIPDADFVNWLKSNGYAACFNGNKMDTTCTSIVSATTLVCYGNSTFTDLFGIQFFDNLNSLTVSYTAVTSFGKLPPLLTYLNLNSNFKLTAISLFPDSLTYLNCSDTKLTSLPALPTSLTELICSDSKLINLPAFPASLQYVYIRDNSLTSLPVLPAGLTSLDCSENLLTSLPTLSVALNYLNCGDNKLDSLPALPSSLAVLLCDGDSMTALPALPVSLKHMDCSGCSKLKSLPALPNSLDYLKCNGTQIKKLPTLPLSLDTLISNFNYKMKTYPTLPPALRHFECSSSALAALPSLPDSLYFLDCSHNNLTGLPSLPYALRILYCGDNAITSLPTLPPFFRDLSCGDNQLTTLPALPSSLIILGCSKNRLTSLPTLPDSLLRFNVSDNPNLNCMPVLKKFTGDHYNFSITGTGITCFPSLIKHQYYITKISKVPICNIFNTTNCNVQWNIKGTVYNDDNSDCQYQTGENKIVPVKLNLYQSGSLIQSSYFLGDYSFDTNFDTYKVEVDTTNFPLNIVCSKKADTTVTVSSSDSLFSDLNFAAQCKPGFDLGVLNINTSRAFFPGVTVKVFTAAGDMPKSRTNRYCNSNVSGTVKIIITGPVTYAGHVVTALTPAVNGDTLTYNIPDFSLVNPVNDFGIILQTKTTATIGDKVCFVVIVDSLSGDNNLSNNVFTQCFPVLNSHDPNEKEVYPIGNLKYPFNDWLTYTIHFQNTGNASAMNINIQDTIDADLDVATFDLLTYSHTPLVNIVNNSVGFYFQNINLIDSATHADSSKGYVSYRIKPKVNLPGGTSITNSASIYFDYNAPIVTNSTVNTIVLATGAATHCTEPSFSIYPNPTNNQLTVSSEQEGDLIISDMLGRTIIAIHKTQNAERIDVSALTPGVYFITLKTERGKAVRKLVKQ